MMFEKKQEEMMEIKIKIIKLMMNSKTNECSLSYVSNNDNS